MTTKTLAAAALAATILSTAVHAEPKMWLNNSAWEVWQDDFGEGNTACYLKHFHQTAKGYATFGLIQNDLKNALEFVYTEDGITWTTGGTITLQVDNITPWKAVAAIFGDDRKMLSIGLDGPNVGQFLQELQFGTTLSVTTLNGARVFSLAGSSEALTTASTCVGRISAERNGPTPTAPAYPLLPGPPRSAPVQSTGPARML